MVSWPIEELDRAKRMVRLSEAPWTLGIAEFESEAEADKARLDWLEREWWNGLKQESGKHDEKTIREIIDAASKAPRPTWTPLNP